MHLHLNDVMLSRYQRKKLRHELLSMEGGMTLRKIRSLRPSDDVARFCKPEALLLDGFRLWSQSPENMTYIRRKFISALGQQSGERAAKALKMLSYLIGVHAHRTFMMYHPGKIKATTDERWLLALIGAALHGERAHATAIVSYLMPINCHGTVLAVAGELGRSLAAGDQVIAPPRKPMVPSQNAVEIRAVA